MYNIASIRALTRIVCTGWVLVLIAAPALAQAPAYDRTAGATLRYHEVTTVETVASVPGGSETSRYEHDAALTLTFARGDTAYAVYESLAVRSHTATDTLAPDTRAVLGDPFVLLFPPDGRVETIATPAFPETFSAVTDLSRQFDDFFVPLPDTALAVGTTWRSERVVMPSDAEEHSRVSRFTVLGDTMLTGERALIIEETAVLRTSATDASRPGILVHVSMEGEETGRLLFSTERGLLLERVRSAHLEGTVRAEGGPDLLVIPQTQTYESTIELVDPMP